MATATIKTLYCVSASTGTDTPVNEALARLPAALTSGDFGGDALAAIQSAIASIPGLIESIDDARQDPDNLYLTTDTAGGRERAFWPAVGSDQDIQSGQSVYVGRSLGFAETLNVSLWDHDWPSGEDLMGSITAYAAEAGVGELIKYATNPRERSAYYVVYQVD